VRGIAASILDAHRLESVDYHSWMDGLRQDVRVMSPFMRVFQHVSRPIVPGHEQNFAVWKNLADFNSRINAGHFGHGWPTLGSESGPPTLTEDHIQYGEPDENGEENRKPVRRKNRLGSVEYDDRN
jgi:hypothetical protein